MVCAEGFRVPRSARNASNHAGRTVVAGGVGWWGRLLHETSISWIMVIIHHCGCETVATQRNNTLADIWRHYRHPPRPPASCLRRTKLRLGSRGEVAERSGVFDRVMALDRRGRGVGTYTS